MKQPFILVVDDEPNNFDVIESLLSHTDYQMHYLSSGEEAIRLLDIFQPDLILLDVMMPGLDGIETCKRIKAMPIGVSLPVIIVTALDRKEDLSRCLTAGADDFIHKPVHRFELDARVRSMLRIRHQYLQLDTFNTQLEQQVQERTSELKKLIYQDQLTALPSRTALLEKVQNIQREGKTSHSLIYIDCDHFSLVNGSFGHNLGNGLIKAIAERLVRKVTADGLLARIGEDEFCFLLTNTENRADIETFITEVQNCFKPPFLVDGCEIYISACVGVSVNQKLESSPEALLQNADTAMYQAKQKGKGSFQFFESKMREKMLNRITLENDLQRALEKQEFFLHYQPIFDIQNQTLRGFEALVRWQHPLRGFVSPGEFIPSMETTGLIIPVGIYVLRQACKQLHAWQQAGYPDLMMSVNLSVRQFSSPTLLRDINQVIAETKVNPAKLNLEITESAIMQNPQVALSVTDQLQAQKINISIDDFGTGYSSLGYLHRFPVNSIKVDRSFINEVGKENRVSNVVKTIFFLSQQLNIPLIAEGIETKEQLSYLEDMGCEYGQGYLFSKPLSAAAVEADILPKSAYQV